MLALLECAEQVGAACVEGLCEVPRLGRLIALLESAEQPRAACVEGLCIGGATEGWVGADSSVGLACVGGCWSVGGALLFVCGRSPQAVVEQKRFAGGLGAGVFSEVAKGTSGSYQVRGCDLASWSQRAGRRTGRACRLRPGMIQLLPAAAGAAVARPRWNNWTMRSQASLGSARAR